MIKKKVKFLDIIQISYQDYSILLGMIYEHVKRFGENLKKKYFGVVVKGLKHGNIEAKYLARPVGVEPTTYGLEVRCSIQLSYRRLTKKISYQFNIA